METTCSSVTAKITCVLVPKLRKTHLNSLRDRAYPAVPLSKTRSVCTELTSRPVFFASRPFSVAQEINEENRICGRVIEMRRVKIRKFPYFLDVLRIITYSTLGTLDVDNFTSCILIAIFSYSEKF